MEIDEIVLDWIGFELGSDVKRIDGRRRERQRDRQRDRQTDR